MAWTPTTINDLTLKVTRRNPELIPPAGPTPHELKPLSDMDNQEVLRLQVPAIQFYRRNPSMDGNDPALVIRSALARALVYYYPLAGRLREHAARKLVVECTGEGVLFIEADADVALEGFGNLQPPFPCLDELLYHVPGSDGVVDCPLMLFQVTRLKCGGFIVALRFNHTMCDGLGIVQFVSAVAEIARGATAPSVLPVWQRHLLSARVSRTHHAYDVVPDTPTSDNNNVVHRHLIFGAPEISALRRHLPPHLRRSTTHDILTACLWRCRTIAVSPDPREEVRVTCAVNARNLFDPPIPEGYYGNAVATTVAIAAAGDLSGKPLHYAVDLVRKAKLQVMMGEDLMVFTGRPRLTDARTLFVSDFTCLGFEQVDYGWGKAAGGEMAVGPNGSAMWFYKPWKNGGGEGQRRIVVPITLAADAMGVFVNELKMMLKSDAPNHPFIKTSAL